MPADNPQGRGARNVRRVPTLRMALAWGAALVGTTVPHATSVSAAMRASVDLVPVAAVVGGGRAMVALVSTCEAAAAAVVAVVLTAIVPAARLGLAVAHHAFEHGGGLGGAVVLGVGAIAIATAAAMVGVANAGPIEAPAAASPTLVPSLVSSLMPALVSTLVALVLVPLVAAVVGRDLLKAEVAKGRTESGHVLVGPLAAADAGDACVVSQGVHVKASKVPEATERVILSAATGRSGLSQGRGGLAGGPDVGAGGGVATRDVGRGGRGGAAHGGGSASPAGGTPSLA